MPVTDERIETAKAIAQCSETARMVIFGSAVNVRRMPATGNQGRVCIHPIIDDALCASDQVAPGSEPTIAPYWPLTELRDDWVVPRIV
jgi:hypothetical protein